MTGTPGKPAAQILDRVGWDGEDMGAVEAARAAEPLYAVAHPLNWQGRLVGPHVQALG
jgi:hypothetical protein